MNPDGVDNYKEINRPEVKIILSEFITEAIVNILSDNEIKKMDFTDKTNDYIKKTIKKIHKNFYNSYIQKIYDIMFNNN